MNYKLISSALLGILLCTSLSAMAKPIAQGNGEVIYLNNSCQDCLLGCAKDRQFGEHWIYDCAKEVCHVECKTHKG